MNRNLIFVTLFRGFLRAVAVRIGIVAIGVVIVGRTRIDGVENHTEDVAFHGGEEVASARKSFLGSFATANDKKNAIANWEVVIQNVPSNFSNRTPAYEASLKKLKEQS